MGTVRASSLRSSAVRRREQHEFQVAAMERDRAQGEADAAKRELEDLKQAATKDERRTWRKSAALSSVITLVVAGLASWATWNTTHFGADEDREKETREHRSQVYSDYLAATRTRQIYSRDAVALLTCGNMAGSQCSGRHSGANLHPTHATAGL